MRKILGFCFLFSFIPLSVFAITDSQILEILTAQGFDVDVIRGQNGISFSIVDPTCFVFAFRNFFSFMQNVLYVAFALLLGAWGIALIFNSKFAYMNNFKNFILIMIVPTFITPVMSFFYGSNPFETVFCEKIEVSSEKIKQLLNVYSNDNAFVSGSFGYGEDLNSETQVQENTETQTKSVVGQINSAPMAADGRFNYTQSGTLMGDPKYKFHATGDCQFDNSMILVFQLEGGYVNHINDKGGETKYGISKNGNPGVDIKNLTTDGAKDIYYQRYYKKYGFDKAPPKIAPLLFRFGIGRGPVSAIKDLQRVLDVKKTGKMDQATLTAINNYQGDLYNDYVDEHKAVLQRIIKNDPSQKVFEKGWNRGAEKVRSNCKVITNTCTIG